MWKIANYVEGQKYILSLTAKIFNNFTQEKPSHHVVSMCMLIKLKPESVILQNRKRISLN